MSDEESEGDDGADLLETFRGILFSDDVVEIRDRVYRIVHRGREAAFSFIRDDDEVDFNWDYLKREEAEIRIVEKGPDEPPFNKIEIDDREVIELNYSVLDEDHQREFVSFIESAFEEQGRFLTHEQEIEFNVAEGARGDPSIEEILEFFDFLPEGDLRLLRRGLSIRRTWEDESIYVEREQMEAWKQDLDNKFGSHGSTVANYCSSGYYDLDSVIPAIMEDMLSMLADMTTPIESAEDSGGK